MSWQHLRDTEPRAHKQHVCVLCELPIPVGEIHVRRDGFMDGVRITARMHFGCHALTGDWDEDDWLHRDPADFRAGLDFHVEATK